MEREKVLHLIETTKNTDRLEYIIFSINKNQINELKKYLESVNKSMEKYFYAITVAGDENHAVLLREDRNIGKDVYVSTIITNCDVLYSNTVLLDMDNIFDLQISLTISIEDNYIKACGSASKNMCTFKEWKQFYAICMDLIKERKKDFKLFGKGNIRNNKLKSEYSDNDDDFIFPEREKRKTNLRVNDIKKRPLNIIDLDKDEY